MGLNKRKRKEKEKEKGGELVKVVCKPLLPHTSSSSFLFFSCLLAISFSSF